LWLFILCLGAAFDDRPSRIIVKPDDITRHNVLPDIDSDIYPATAFAKQRLAGLKPDFPIGRLVVSSAVPNLGDPSES
jgi:hypothetical protein